MLSAWHQTGLYNLVFFVFFSSPSPATLGAESWETQAAEEAQWADHRDSFMEVYVSAVETPGHFWVQILSSKATQLDQLISEMSRHYAQVTPMVRVRTGWRAWWFKKYEKFKLKLKIHIHGKMTWGHSYQRKTGKKILKNFERWGNDARHWV